LFPTLQMAFHLQDESIEFFIAHGLG
jgi:hypothetical protein